MAESTDLKSGLRKKGGLGRGLGALLGGNMEVEAEVAAVVAPEVLAASTLMEVPLDQLEANPYQPRLTFEPEALAELSESIRVQGIIQPITVRQVSPNKYQIIAGERRTQASRLAGKVTIPAYIIEVNNQQMLEMALIENVQRADLNPIEIALSFQRMISEVGLKQEELGDRVGKKRSTVANYLRLLKLPPVVQDGIKEGKISMGHARALVNVDRAEDQLFIYNQILEKELSVRTVEALVRQLMAPKAVSSNTDKGKSNTGPSATEIEIKHLTKRLVQRFGTKVQIASGKGSSGQIVIPYQDFEDLSRILDLMQ